MSLYGGCRRFYQKRDRASRFYCVCHAYVLLCSVWNVFLIVSFGLCFHRLFVASLFIVTTNNILHAFGHIRLLHTGVVAQTCSYACALVHSVSNCLCILRRRLHQFSNDSNFVAKRTTVNPRLEHHRQSLYSEFNTQNFYYPRIVPNPQNWQTIKQQPQQQYIQTYLHMWKVNFEHFFSKIEEKPSM